MTERRREYVPPFVHIGAKVYVVESWDEDVEDAPQSKELIIRKLERLEAKLHRELVHDAEVEAFARIEGRRHR